MTENLLQLGVEDLFARLHQALVGLQLQAVRALSKVVEQHWAFAVVRRDREKTRTLCAKLLEVSATAAVLEEEGAPTSVWNQRWLTLSEMGGLVLAIDTDSASLEDRERLKNFDHAERVICFLGQQSISTPGDIQRDLKERGTHLSSQACWNHINRLVKMGVVQRIDEGLYRLSPRGREVARLLAMEAKALGRRTEELPIAMPHIQLTKIPHHIDKGETRPDKDSAPARRRVFRKASRSSNFSAAQSRSSVAAAGMTNLMMSGVISVGSRGGMEEGPRAEVEAVESFLDAKISQPVVFGR